VTHAEDLRLSLDSEQLLLHVLVALNSHVRKFAWLGLGWHHDFVILDAPVLQRNSYDVARLHEVALLLERLELPLLHDV